MYELKPEPQFKKDYQKLKRTHPELMDDLFETLGQLQVKGFVNPEYHPHILVNRGGNYTGYYEYHLSDGKVDVLVIYMPHKTNPQIRLVRVGSHGELFHSELK